MRIPGGTPVDIEPCKDFWDGLDRLAALHPVVIDRSRHTRHPRFPALIYPVDYGYLEGTASAADGEGLDVWRGGAPQQTVCAAICTVDLLKGDAEVKLLIGCTEAEILAVEAFHNQTGYQKGLLLRRGKLYPCDPPDGK